MAHLLSSLTSKTHRTRRGSAPSRPRSTECPSRNEYRGLSAAEALAALERALVTQVAAETVAAIVIEPVQGEGGFVVAPQEFMDGVRRLCDEHGIVMVVDEVQTGFRAHRQAVCDRALRRRARSDHDREVGGDGAAALGRDRQGAIMDAAPPDSAIGGTYVGNPVAQAAALTVLDVIGEEGTLRPRLGHR